MDIILSQMSYQLMMLMRNYHRKYLEQFNLFLGQPRILKLLRNTPGLSQKELTQELGVAKETISMSVKRLMKNGLIHRELDPQDKRKFCLFLSNSGIELLQKVEQDQELFHQTILKGLSEQEKQQLLIIFEKMIHNLKEDQ